MKTTPLLAASLLTVALLAGCSKSEPGAAADAAAFPQTLFVSAIDQAPVPIAQAQADAKEGDTVVLHGRIGGRKDPFTAGRAVFMLVDTVLQPCVDGCATPWDYCCDDQAEIAANAATIQVVDASGAVIRSAINGVRGIAPGAEVIVAGAVARRDDAANLTVNATQIWVKGN